VEEVVINVRAEARKANAEKVAELENLPVDIQGENCPGAISTWDDCIERKIFNEKLKETMLAEGMAKPTLIQRYAIPVIADKGRPDVVALAQTGSGKTFAFVIPCVSNLLMQGPVMRPWFPGNMAQSSPLCLMLSPTRELAIQTEKEIQSLIKGSVLKCLVMYGGETISVQLKVVKDHNFDIVVGTPGRVGDAVDHGKLTLSYVQTLVLDEADMMLDQGLEGAVDQIITQKDMPEKDSRQTLLFSATLPPKIEQIVDKVCRKSRIVMRIGHYTEDKGGSCEKITQYVKYCDDDTVKFNGLFDDIMNLWPRAPTGHLDGKVVIFINRIKQATHVSNVLRGRGLQVGHLHGKQDQPTREDVVENYRTGVYNVLVATNVAARGLDFPDIKLVVNFDMPEEISTYTHRIGRTGRVGTDGWALAYLERKDKRIAEALISFLELNHQEVPEWLRRLVPRPEPERRGKGKGKGIWDRYDRDRRDDRRGRDDRYDDRRRR
jgi:ATP-dependent RNA helicase DDX3X